MSLPDDPAQPDAAMGSGADPSAAPAVPLAASAASSTGLDPRVASLLCYMAWWMTGLLFLFIERRDRTVRFHAAQSLVVFGGFTLVMAVVGVANLVALFTAPAFFQTIWSGNLLVWLASVIVWAVLSVQALRGEVVRVPLVAGMADRLADAGRDTFETGE